MNSSSQFAQIFANYIDIKSQLKFLNEFFDENKYTIEKFGTKNLEKVKGLIEFKDVSFSYEENSEEKKETKLILNKISFKIEPNSTVAFVGKSGSGKTTILNLISKLYTPNSGQILIDGVEISQLNKKSIRNNISLVNQFPYIFNATIKNNLLLAKKDATDEEIEITCKKTYLNEFINDTKNSIDTMVGEGGVKISGGQKQRIAIARAILKDSPIVIFDESTSSLDNESQKIVTEGIDTLKGNKTIIIVAHRLSTIKNVDKIFYLEDGKIIDEGTFKELYKKNKSFKKMFTIENLLESED